MVLPPRLGEGSERSLKRALSRQARRATVVFDCRGLEEPDALGVARLLRVVADARAAGRDVRLAGLTEPLRGMLAGIDPAVLEAARPPQRRHPLEVLGRAALDAAGAAGEITSLLRKTLTGFAVPFGRKGLKWDRAINQMVQIGVAAVPIVVFISFLVGVVLGLNGAQQLRQFGAAIFIANLVAISMTREMAPLITAIIVAGRSGSAIAAEIGTMVVSEEVDAMQTMGLSPVRFLVVPKVLALAMMVPLLTVLSGAAGIFGGYIIGVVNLRLPSSAYLSQTVQSLFVSDVLTGLIKSVVFATLIGLVGAYRGFSVRGGPEAVGRATTSAVVLSIILCIVANAGFTMFFYYVT